MNCKLLAVLVGCAATLAASTPPMPPVVSTKKVTLAQSPRAKEQAKSLAKVALIVQAPPRLYTNTLAADFYPTAILGLTAFIDAKTNLLQTNWFRQSLPYPADGGTMKVAFTNFGQIYFRAGYTY